MPQPGAFVFVSVRCPSGMAHELRGAETGKSFLDWPLASVYPDGCKETKLGVQSIDDLQVALREHEYVADRGLATAIFLSLNLGRPLFLEGEAGVGKTEVAKVVARLLETELIRLQCYEGLDVHHAVYEWNYSRQMMHIRLAESRTEQTDEAELFGPQFLLKRPLLQAIEESRDKAPVLLVDDRASVARSLSKKTVLLPAGSAEDSRRKPSPKPVPLSRTGSLAGFARETTRCSSMSSFPRPLWWWWVPCTSRSR